MPTCTPELAQKHLQNTLFPTIMLELAVLLKAELNSRINQEEFN